MKEKKSSVDLDTPDNVIENNQESMLKQSESMDQPKDHEQANDQNVAGGWDDDDDDFEVGSDGQNDDQQD